MGARAGRRERKKRAVYRSLREEAVRLVTERGLEGVTVKDIAMAAGVSLRTFYRHFPSKEAAVAGGSHEVRRLFTAFVADQPGVDPPISVVRRSLHFRTTLISPEQRVEQPLVVQYPSLERHFLGAVRDLERDLMAGLVARAGNTAQASVYVELLCAFAGAAYRVAMAEWRRTDRPLPAILDEVLDYVEHGLAESPESYSSAKYRPRLAKA